MKTLSTPPLMIALVAPAVAEDVTEETFVRAQSDHMIRANMNTFGVEIGKLTHVREAIMYEPRDGILDGSWVFPAPQPLR